MEMVVNCKFVSLPLKNFERMSIYGDISAKPNKEQREQLNQLRVDATIAIDTQCTYCNILSGSRQP